MSKLSIKQQAFAARKAGYSENYAKGNVSKLLENERVKKYIEDRLEEIQSEKIASQKEVLEHLTRVMRREEQEHQVVTLRTKQEKWLPDDQGTMRKQTVETEEAEVVPMPTRVSDTNKAAELLGKRYAMWTDKQDITATEVVTIVDDVDD
ncbi:MAG: terminase small subunit [Enterococcus avium]|nr:terminase small subunit [Enterococcus avium]